MKKVKRLLFVAVLLALVLLAIWGNTALEVNTYEISHRDIPAAFDGFRIAQVSDLHNAQMGKNNSKLLKKLTECAPDIIAITGDMIDSRRPDVEIALAFAEEAMKIAPCYYVAGNHEARLTEYDSFRRELIALGVTVLDDEKVTLEREGEEISVAGVCDTDFPTEIVFSDPQAVMRYKLSSLIAEEGFSLLLTHRPEYFDVYEKSGADLALCGHAHGGQIRLPYLGGLFSPNQGFFPEYDAGLYTQRECSMLVSRGIGNSLFPLRINNPPEVILAELKTAKTAIKASKTAKTFEVRA